MQQHCVKGVTQLLELCGSVMTVFILDIVFGKYIHFAPERVEGNVLPCGLRNLVENGSYVPWSWHKQQ